MHLARIDRPINSLERHRSAKRLANPLKGKEWPRAVEGFIRHERSPEDKQVRGLSVSKIEAPHASPDDL